MLPSVAGTIQHYAVGRRCGAPSPEWLRAALKVTKPYAEVSDKIVSVSLGLALDDVGFHVIPHYDKDNERLSTSYLIRMGDLEPDVSTRKMFARGRHVVSLPMKGACPIRKHSGSITISERFTISFR